MSSICDGSSAGIEVGGALSATTGGGLDDIEGSIMLMCELSCGKDGSGESIVVMELARTVPAKGDRIVSPILLAEFAQGRDFEPIDI